MGEMTPEERRKFERMAPVVHVKYLEGQWLGRIIKAMRQEEDPVKLAEDIAKREVTLEQESIRDHLTGAFNRAYIGAFMGREITLARKYRRWDLGLIYLDLDHFKEINDGEPAGHAAGDETLKGAVEIMKEIGGEEAIAGRWGGEEFMMVIPETDIGKLKQLAINLGNEIKEKLARRAKLEREKVTASMGVVILKEDDDLIGFITRGDRMMYEAKEAGRSRVVIQDADGQQETILIE